MTCSSCGRLFYGSNPVISSKQTFFAEQKKTKLTPAFYGYFCREMRKIRPCGSLFDRTMTGFYLILQYFRCFCPCGHEKTLICLVDKLAFFYGIGEGIRIGFINLEHHSHTPIKSFASFFTRKGPAYSISFGMLFFGSVIYLRIALLNTSLSILLR